ncbi:unnamed protein product [Closterium sp. NIES-53]
MWQLCRPVYGLKQAPREWHAKLSATLGSLVFFASHSDASLFLRSSPRRFFILVYVDDMILIADFKSDMEKMKQQLQQRLNCKDLGDLTHYLGMAITGSHHHPLPVPLHRLDLGESSLPSTAPAEAVHTFTLDSGASRCFFRESTTLTPLPAPVPVRLADPSGGPVLARSSTFLPFLAVLSGSLSGLHLPSFSTNLVSTAALQDAMVTTTTPGGQRVSICTCTRTGRHLATFTRRPGSTLYTLTTEPPRVAAFAQVSASDLVTPPPPRLRGMQSRLPVCSLPRSLPPLPPSPAPPCLRCIEGRQRAAPHSSFPLTTAPLQTLHVDVKGEVPDVLIPWIRTVRLQLRERFCEDLPVLRLHSDRGGEFSSNLLRDFCHGEGILQSFTLSASPQQNGVAERRIGLVMEPRVSLPETLPTLCWTGNVGDASLFRVWGSCSFVRDTSANKLSSRAIPCVFLGFPPDVPCWQFYHPTSHRVLPSQDVPFDESVPFYRLFPYHDAPLPPSPPLFLAPGPPSVDPLPPQGPAPSSVSQVDPIPLAEPVEVTVDSGAARGTASGGAELASAEPGGAEPASAEPGGAEPGGAEPEGADPGGDEFEGAKSGGAEHEGAELGGAESEGAESGDAEPRDTASAGGHAGASPRLSHGREPLSPQQLREWFTQCTRLRSGAARGGGPVAGGTGAGGAGAASLRGAGVPAGARGTGGAGAAGLGGARTRGTGAAGACGDGGTGAGDPGAGGFGAGDPGGGGSGAGGAGVGGAGAGDPGAGGPAARGTGAVGARVTAGAGGPRGAGAAGPRGARTRGTRAAGVGGVGGTRARDPRAGGTEVRDPGAGCTGAGDRGAGGTGTGGVGAGGAGAGGAGVGGPRAGGARAGDPGAGGVGAGGNGAGGIGARGTVQRRPFFVPAQPSSLPPPDSVLRQVLSLPSSTGLTPRLLCPPPHHTQPQLQPDSPLPAPSPYVEQTDSLTQRREPKSRPALRCLHWSSCYLTAPDPDSDFVCAAIFTAPHLLATVVTNPSFESAPASALVAELVDFAAACRLDYAASFVAESESVCPPSVGGECALGTNVLEDRQEDFECLSAAVPHLVAMLLAREGDPDAPDISTPRSYAEAITGPYSSQWQIATDVEMASWKSTGTYVDAVPPSGVNIVNGMWIFRVKRTPGSLPVFKARYVARGFCQREGVDFFRTFSPTPKMTTLRVLLHVAAQRDYELHSLYFSTTFLQGSLHEEIWLRRPPGFTGSFPAGTQWRLRRPVYGLCQAPREWHDTLRSAEITTTTGARLRASMGARVISASVELQKRHICTDLGELRSYPGLQITRDRARCTITLTLSHMVHQVLQRFGFRYSSPQSTPLPTGYSLSAPPSDESVEPSGPYPELVGCLMYLMTYTRPDLAYPLSILARYVALGRHRPEHWEAAKRVLRYLCSTSGMGLVLGGWGPVVLTGHGDASWSTRSSSVLSSSCEVEIYVGVIAAQELRWLAYLLTDLGERPRSSLNQYSNSAKP